MKKVLVIELSGGLGNQLFQYYFSLFLQHRLKYLDIDIVFSDYWFKLPSRKRHEISYLNNLYPGFLYSKFPFLLNYLLHVPLLRVLLPLFSPIISRIVDFEVVTERSLNCFRIDHCMPLKLNSNSPRLMLLRGHWQCCFSEIYDPVLISELRESLFVSRSLKSFAQYKSQASVCAHIRRGDYQTNRHLGSLTHTVLPEAYYKKALQWFTRTLPKPLFVIFSDDIEWCKLSGVFYEYSVRYMDPDSFSSDLECFLCMSNFSNFILANSTYSFWAALVSGTLRNIVYPLSFAPAHFFNEASFPSSVNSLPLPF